ncbi:hypothetical protein BH739_16325 [Enterococcus casseliflavus]|nr:hypothetical protein BH739_16325 [Enterococcus casseliflavus]
MEKNILIVAHGGLAEAIKNSAELFAGPQNDLHFVNLEPQMGTEELRENILKKISKQKLNVVLVDIPGGTPCNECLKIAIDTPNMILISGVNLAMVLETVLYNGGEDEIATSIMNAGTSSVRNMTEELKNISIEED